MTDKRQFRQPVWSGRLPALVAMVHEPAAIDQLVALALHDPSADFVEAYLLGVAIGASDVGARALAIKSIGHSARVRGQLACAETLPTLTALGSVPELAGVVEDALSDIRIFTRK